MSFVAQLSDAADHEICLRCGWNHREERERSRKESANTLLRENEMNHKPMVSRPGQPVTPLQALNAKAISIEVIDIFNELLAERYNGISCIIKQEEVVERFVGLGTVTRNEIFDRHYLDIENTFRNAGWKVEYDKPGFNESYDAFWTFSAGEGKT